jgi:hypothetical protein
LDKEHRILEKPEYPENGWKSPEIGGLRALRGVKIKRPRF